MSRFTPNERGDEFAWICSVCGQWNRSEEARCRACGELKPQQPEKLRDLLEQISREHPRKTNDDD